MQLDEPVPGGLVERVQRRVDRQVGGGGRGGQAEIAPDDRGRREQGPTGAGSASRRRAMTWRTPRGAGIASARSGRVSPVDREPDQLPDEERVATGPLVQQVDDGARVGSSVP